MAWIYVLHFDEKLSHAQHYIGCTEKLSQRLEAHANGAGARITKELKRQGIEFRLGSVMECTHVRMRELERSLKDQANSKRYCAVCSNPPAKFDGTKHYPVEACRFPTTSEELRKRAAPRTVQTVRMTTENEPRSTIESILGMMRADKDALGFIPAGGSAGLQTLIVQGKICVAECEGEVVGYVAWNVNPHTLTVSIHQCCTRDDFRFMGVGKAMLEMVMDRPGVLSATAKVRIDLAANWFWESMGFVARAQIRHKTSQNQINHYFKSLNEEHKG